MIGRHKIGLGTVQFGLSYGIANKTGQTKLDEVTKILDLAKEYQINVLDTASAYGNAEEILGNNDLDSFLVISKFMPPKDEKINVQLEESLKLLGLDQLYGYLAHRPISLLENPEQWEELLCFKDQGKVLKIGFSLNDPDEMEKLLDRGFLPDIVQVPFNYFDNRFENLLVILKSKGCEVHTRSTFLQGLFFMQPSELSPIFNEIKADLCELQLMKEHLSVSLLNFVLQKEFIDKVIIGVESSKQLHQNIEGLHNAKELPNLERTVSSQIINPSQWKN